MQGNAGDIRQGNSSKGIVKPLTFQNLQQFDVQALSNIPTPCDRRNVYADIA